MKTLFTSLLIIGYIGHSCLLYMGDKTELSVAMLLFAVAMMFLF